MRRLAALVATLGAVLSIGLAAPPQASACTGCVETFKEFVDSSPLIVLTRYEGRSGRLSQFDVISVLKGRSARTLSVYASTFLGPRPRVGSRWLLAPFAGVLPEAFRVDRDGTVTDMAVGAGATDGYPTTLAGWYRALGLPMPDTSTANAATVDPLAPGTTPPLALLLAAALVGVGAALHRQRGGAVTGRRRGQLAARSAGPTPSPRRRPLPRPTAPG